MVKVRKSLPVARSVTWSTVFVAPAAGSVQYTERPSGAIAPSFTCQRVSPVRAETATIDAFAAVPGLVRMYSTSRDPFIGRVVTAGDGMSVPRGPTAWAVQLAATRASVRAYVRPHHVTHTDTAAVPRRFPLAAQERHAGLVLVHRDLAPREPLLERMADPLVDARERDDEPRHRDDRGHREDDPDHRREIEKVHGEVASAFVMPASSCSALQLASRSSCVARISALGVPSAAKCGAKRPSVRAKARKSTTVPSGCADQSVFGSGLPCSESRSFSVGPFRGS